MLPEPYFEALWYKTGTKNSGARAPLHPPLNHGRKSRGGGGDASPHDFEGGGHNIKCPPPPHVFVVGRFFFFSRKNRIFNKICLPFFFFFACENVGVGPTGTPNLLLKNCQRRWRCGFRFPPPPPPHYPLRISALALNAVYVFVRLSITFNILA